jgi:putative endopeptidase
MNRIQSIVSITLIVTLGAFAYKTYEKGIDVAGMDKSVRPQDDFFKYVNGNWINNNPIPASESRWGNFNVLAEKNLDLLHKILKDAAADDAAPKGSIKRKVGDFYKIAMDTVKLKNEGTQPVVGLLAYVNQLNVNTQVVPVLADLHRKGVGGFFGMYVGLDVKDNEKYRVWFSQGGLGLPDRDYYLKQDEKSKRIRDEYTKHIVKMFELYGYSKEIATASATHILNMETGLAKASMSRVENRNMEKKYNKRSMTDLAVQYPSIQWDQYMSITGLTGKNIDTVIIAQPEFFQHLNKLISEEPIVNIKSYLTWRVIQNSDSYLSEEIGRESFRFYGSVIQGAKEQKPRWKRTVASANSLIGELVAQEYVKVAFSEESKRKVNEMVDNLREAYRLRINKLDWMGEETKARAMEKLASFNRKLGYPDKWKDYSGLDINLDNYYSNYLRASEFGFQRMIDKIGKPVDKSEWNMLPQTVNAYYSPIMNEIVFPAAIMQPPFFDPNADDAINYGAIGAVIGHEFSHGFDDQGSKYDAKGNFNSWWTDNDRKEFEKRTKLLVNQFNTFQVLDSVFVNGELTLGENIADLAGLTVAYDAYMISIKGKKQIKIAGFTPEQRFFLGFGQVWRGHAREEYLRNQVVTDPHSPQQFRVFGTLRNMPSFYEAFGVKKGDKMWLNESDQVKIW